MSAKNNFQEAIRKMKALQAYHAKCIVDCDQKEKALIKQERYQEKNRLRKLRTKQAIQLGTLWAKLRGIDLTEDISIDTESILMHECLADLNQTIDFENLLSN